MRVLLFIAGASLITSISLLTQGSLSVISQTPTLEKAPLTPEQQQMVAEKEAAREVAGLPPSSG